MNSLPDERFEEILEGFSQARVAVLGDFFLDLYIQLDRSLSELSLETNLEAFQATRIKGQPGAAGVVTNNLTSLGASASAIAYTGDDGNGYTLRKALRESGVEDTFLLERPDRLTPTYTKPMMKEVGGQTVELNRIDIRNRSPNPPDLEAALIECVYAAIKEYDGILVTEQVAEDGCGVLSPPVRNALAEAAQHHPGKPILVDSRHFTHRYQGVGLKVNFSEALRAAGMLNKGAIHQEDASRLESAKRCQRLLWKKLGQPIFITLGSQGLSGIAAGREFHHPAYPVGGPIDIVGAGDSVLAGIGLALCVSASSEEAAYIGNLVGSITIQQIGTTGIATQSMLRKRHKEYQNSLNQ